MKKTIISTLVVITALVFTSCSKKNDNLYNAIPDDAIAVAKIDVKQLLQKSDITNNKKVKELFEDLKKEIDNSKIEKKLEDPSSLGIDALSEALIVAEVREDDNFNAYGYLFIPLTDGDKFKKTLDEIDEGNVIEYESKGEIKAFCPDHKCVIAFNSNLLIIEYVDGYVRDKSDLVSDVKKLFKKTHSLEKEGFDIFKSNTDDLAIWLDLEALVDLARKDKEVKTVINKMEEMTLLDSKDLKYVLMSYNTVDQGGKFYIEAGCKEKNATLSMDYHSDFIEGNPLKFYIDKFTSMEELDDLLDMYTKKGAMSSVPKNFDKYAKAAAIAESTENDNIEIEGEEDDYYTDYYNY